MHSVLEMNAQLIGLVGIVIISWGVLLATIRFIMLEARRFGGVNTCQSREVLRHHLGSYLLLGLEFLVAADIIHTVLRPSMEELVILGGLVAIRTVLNLSLNRELAGHSCPVDQMEK